VEDIRFAADTEIGRIANILATLKERKRQYVLVDKVLEGFDSKKLQLARVVDPMTVTDEISPVTRTMTANCNPPSCFPNVLNAISEAFLGCTNFKYKIIKSLANDPPQL
jgi:hypothetical protein